MQHQFRKTALLAPLLSASLVISGCSDNDDNDDTQANNAQVRIIHASADAPAVNIKLDGMVAIGDLDYAESTGFAEIPAGVTDVAVEAIIPGANLDVLEVPDFDFATDGQYTIIAVGETASIDTLLVSDSSATPSASEVAVTVVHAATAADEVDVYVTAADTVLDNSVDATFSFDFEGAVDAGALPAGTYRIRVTAPDNKTPVYDSGAVDLTPFAGQKLLITAINTVNATQQDASPIKLLVATADNSLVLLDADTEVGARVVHLSPDAATAAAGPVEVFASSSALGVDPVELIDAFAYTDIVPAGGNSYVNVPGGDYVFDVAPNTDSIGDSVYTSASLSLAAGNEYSVIASGYVATTPAFGLLATADDNRSIATQASVKVVHAAPAATSVDVYVTPAGNFNNTEVESGMAGDPLLEDFTYATITDYVAVAEGDYDIRVVFNGSVAISDTYTLSAGNVYTVIAHQPGDGVNDFGFVVLTN